MIQCFQGLCFVLKKKEYVLSMAAWSPSLKLRCWAHPHPHLNIQDNINSPVKSTFETNDLRSLILSHHCKGPGGQSLMQFIHSQTFFEHLSDAKPTDKRGRILPWWSLLFSPGSSLSEPSTPKKVSSASCIAPWALRHLCCILFGKRL